MSFSFLRSGDRERSRDLDRERERDLDLERRRAVGEGSFGAEDCAGAASAMTLLFSIATSNSHSHFANSSLSSGPKNASKSLAICLPVFLFPTMTKT
mmetsp:Transcript_1686/g.3808  ORF Transcript_1686/g.3808 Transcript_1686/m.3808 type:complete len:97 (+) Transcript_1686:195-485(+)